MRRLLSLFLVCAILMIPAFSLAETAEPLTAAALERGYTTLSGSFSMELTETAAGLLQTTGLDSKTLNGIVDVLNAAGFRFTVYSVEKQRISEDVAVTLSGQDALVMKIDQQDDTIYVATNLFQDVWALQKDEYVSFMRKNLKNSGMSDEQVEQMVNMMSAAFDGGNNEALENLFGSIDFNAMAGTLQEIMETANITAASQDELPEGCDPVAAKAEIRITGEQLTQIVKPILEAIGSNEAFQPLLNAGGNSVSMDEVIARLPEAFKDMEPIDIALYLNGQGEMVAISAVIKTTDGAQTKFNMQETVWVETAENGRYRKVQLTETESKLEVAAVILENSDTAIQFSMDMKQNGQQMLSITAEGTKANTETESTSDVTVNVSIADLTLVAQATQHGVLNADSYESSATCLLSVPMLGEDPLLKIDVSTLMNQDSRESIATPDAVHVMAMSEEELNAYGQSLTGQLQQNLQQVLQLLPQSTLQLMMQN